MEMRSRWNYSKRVTNLISALLISIFASLCLGAATDNPRDADQQQSGYLDNHNMDPAIIQGATFGELWRVKTGGEVSGVNEQYYAKPLVYTPKAAGSKQVVFTASETNWVYVLDAVTGQILNKKQVATPFLVSDIGCNDISGFIGITGTPVIDPATDTVYFYSKSYPGEERGVYNGAYWIYALDVMTLTDRPGFPRKVDGAIADNDPTRYFHGGTHLQRTSLSLINGVVYAGFGGHCDKYNFTGWVIGVDAATADVKATFACESGAFAPPQDGTFNGGGGGAGIWMSGMSLSSDSPNRLFFVTGNGEGHQNKEVPASGRTPLDTLDETIVNLRIDPATGKLSLQDYFEPYEYISMDAGDRDLGSGGITLLDPTVFNGGSIARLGVTVGKNGKAYIVNVDNLGGFKMGPAGSDNVIQTLQMPGGGSVFGGTGSYPLEGGYIYMTPVGYPTLVYKFGRDSNGIPKFTQVSQTDENSAGRVGVGVPTITTFKGQPGTGILWIADVDGGLRAYKAVPEGGKMIRINLPPTPSVSKFQRPSFGDGRLYLSTSNGYIQCLGSPVSLPLNCTSPVNFGDVAITEHSTQIVNCTALIPITKIEGLIVTGAFFEASNSSLPIGSLAIGKSFSFPVTFNLTNAIIQDIPGTSVPSVKPGIATGALSIITVNGVVKYSNSQPIVLSGNTVSTKAFLSINPIEASFGGIVIGSQAAETGLESSIVIMNIGLSPLTILGYSWTEDSLESPSEIVWTNVTEVLQGVFSVGDVFTALDLPVIGTIIQPGVSITISLRFKPEVVGNYHSIFQIWSDGGDQYTLLAGTATIAPKALLQVSTSEGGWSSEDLIDFGPQLAGVSLTRQIRLNNTGGSALTITKSKPMEGAELTATNPTGELSEGLKIAPGDAAYGNVLFAPAVRPVNLPPIEVNGTWTLNTDDLTFGIHEVLAKGTILSRQLGPLLPDGSSRYKYLGCYQDAQAGRLFKSNTNFGATLENGICQQNCLTKGYIFAGTEYHRECWCGDQVPSLQWFHPESENKCTWTCNGDTSQACGGDGAYINVYYDSTRYTKPDGTTSLSATTTSGTIATSATSATDTSSNTITITSSSIETSNTDSSTTISDPTSSNTLGATNGSSSTSEVVLATSTTTSSSLPTYTGPPLYVQQMANFTHQGCWTEATTGRALTGKQQSNVNMTVPYCWEFCNAFTFFGVEYGKECYCGNALQAGSVNSTSGNLCNIKCAANSTQICGGRSRLNLYQYNVTWANFTDVLTSLTLPLGPG